MIRWKKDDIIWTKSTFHFLSAYPTSLIDIYRSRFIFPSLPSTHSNTQVYLIPPCIFCTKPACTLTFLALFDALIQSVCQSMSGIEVFSIEADSSVEQIFWGIALASLSSVRSWEGNLQSLALGEGTPFLPKCPKVVQKGVLSHWGALVMSVYGSLFTLFSRWIHEKREWNHSAMKKKYHW